MKSNVKPYIQSSQATPSWIVIVTYFKHWSIGKIKQKYICVSPPLYKHKPLFERKAVGFILLSTQRRKNIVKVESSRWPTQYKNTRIQEYKDTRIQEYKNTRI